MERGASYPQLPLPLRGQHSHTTILKNWRLTIVAQGDTSTEIWDRSCPPWLHDKFWTLRSHQNCTQHLTRTGYPQTRQKGRAGSQRKNMSGLEYRKWSPKWTCLTLDSQSTGVDLTWESSSCGDSSDT